jgi:GxxExxY protein
MDLLKEGLIYKNESFEIIGACMEVHRELGCGFLEAVYQEALALEFSRQNIPYEQEVLLQVNYKGQALKKEYKADFICFDKIIIELKAVSKFAPEHLAQTLNYLKITDYKLGILVNFGTTSLQYKRIVL